MRNMRFLLLMICLGLTLAAAPPASAQTPSGYLLVELAADGAGIEELRGLMNCLQLVESLVPGEAVVHLDCNDVASLNQAVGDFAKVKGVAQVTLWTIKGGE